MTTVSSLTVLPIAAESEEIERVFELYRSNTARLGWLPRGAFDECALSGGILGAFVGDLLCGYMACRIAGRQTVIVHLCVRTESRGQGVARALMQELIESELGARPIRLSCREDYLDANALWPLFGFTCDGVKTGRGRDGTQLFCWSRRPELPLVERMQDAELEGRLRVVLDANVFLDLQQPAEGVAEESHALLADWLQPDVALCVTAELSNEISRHKSAEQREERWAQANQFEKLKGAPAEVEGALQKLRLLMPETRQTSDESDRRHLAHAIAKHADFFITRDQALLACGEAILQSTGIATLRPVDFLIRMHAQQGPSAFQPARLAGTRVMARLVKSETEMLPFQDFSSAESKVSWVESCRTVLLDPKRYATKIVTPEGGADLVLYAVDCTSAEGLRVLFLRTMRNPMTPTIVRRVVSELLTDAMNRGARFVEICGPVSDVVSDALADLEFTCTTTGMRKEVVACLVCVGGRAGPARRGIVIPDPLRMEDVVAMERKYWPLKLVDDSIPTYLVPIQPRWASQLFDVELARRELFGPPAELALALENVYYSGSPMILPEGARILWYVSKDGRDTLQQVRACSLCLGTERGEASKIFRRFTRLGVYRWSDVVGTVRGDAKAPITAYRFAWTECFANPIPWAKLQEVLKELNGSRNPVAGPVKISAAAFSSLYAAATRYEYA